MSLKMMIAVWDTPMESHTEKLVALALADNASDQGVCWPSIATLARKCDLSERAVQKNIRSLECRGVLSVRQTTGRSSVYQITVSQPLNAVHSTPERRSPPPLNAVHHGVNAVHPNSKEQSHKLSDNSGKEVATLPTPASDALKETKRFKAPSLEEVQLQCSKIGLAESEAERFLNYHASRGWVVGKAPMKNWHFALNTWKMNAVKFKAESSSMPSRFAAKPTRADGEFCANWRNKDTSEMTPKELTAYSIQ